LMVAGGEVVGMCSHKTAPDAEGAVEIGYGVAATRRRLGYASRAVSDVITDARADPRIRRLTAETALANIASHRVLEVNGFALTGERKQDPDDGEVAVWALAVK
jgi:RimJ/RimL family protein N-acetyltransferase